MTEFVKHGTVWIVHFFDDLVGIYNGETDARAGMLVHLGAKLAWMEEAKKQHPDQAHLYEKRSEKDYFIEEHDVLIRFAT